MKKAMGVIIGLLSWLPSTLVRLILPVRGKRIIFVTTIYLWLREEESSEPPTLDQLNSALHLATTTEALLLPAKLYHLIWGEELRHLLIPYFSDKATLTDDGRIDPKPVCREIVEHSPSWLRYGKKENMINDLLGVFEEIHRPPHSFAHAQTA